MPATFAHCLVAKRAIDKVSDAIKANDPQREKKLEYAQKIGEKNNFVVMGAAGPDYPYLTDILTTSILPISHTWANRMHYEKTLSFIQEGVKRLAGMDKKEELFSINLAWFCGFVSHVLADSLMHPVINLIIGGPYIFTHEEHGKCELIQDIYIFKKITDEDIVDANPRGGNLGYLKILEECSDPADKDNTRIHPAIRGFWKELLEAAHPLAKEYFGSITPDIWHYNYLSRVNFIADPGAIFRHVVGLTGRDYKRVAEILPAEKNKYIDKIRLPSGETANYEKLFKKAVSLIVDKWLNLFEDIETRNLDRVTRYIKDWNLDTGVDESQIDLWSKREA
jgi:hypothetical protein